MHEIEESIFFFFFFFDTKSTEKMNISLKLSYHK